MTIRDLLKSSQTKLEQAGIPSARLDCLILLEDVTGKDRSWIQAHDEEELPSEQHEQFNRLIETRSNRTSIAHILHTREFYGLPMYIDEGVLTPRVETERIAEWAIKYAPKNSSLIDIGTGSGNLAVAIAKHRPDLTVTGTDVTQETLAVARKNADHYQIPVKLVLSDLFNQVPDQFETVVTNLPYLSLDEKNNLLPEVKREPAVALFGGEGDGMDLYRRFLVQLPDHLAPGGYLFTECDPWQQPDLIKEASKAGLEVIEQDYFILGFRLS